MVAISRALMSHPRLLCMDEPSMGLSPVFVEQVFDIIQTINRQGTTIFMVEQNARQALQISDYGLVLEQGQARIDGPAADILADKRIARLFLKLGENIGRPAPDGIAIPMALSRQELADLTGTTIDVNGGWWMS